MLQTMFAAKNVFQSQSMPIIASSIPGRMISKCTSLNMLPLVRRTSSFLQIRSFSCNNKEDQVLKSSTSEEDRIKRLNHIIDSLEYFHCDLVSKANRSTLKIEELPSIEEEKLSYRKRWATYRLISKIDDITRRLTDENVDEKCRIFYLVDRFEKFVIHTNNDKNFEFIDYEQCWQSLLKSSEHPLAHKLKEELNKVGITPQTFSKSICDIYFSLQEELLFFDFWSIKTVDFGPDDMKSVLNDLQTNDTQYKCIKILFNLEEPEKWQIKDREKV